MKQMFDISEKLISEQSDEIYGVNAINCVILHGNIFLWLVAKKSSASRAQILRYVLERWTRTLAQTQHGKKDWRGSKVHRNTELWIELMVSQLNSSGISSQDSPRCSSATKFKSYCWDWVKHQRILQDGSSSCRCSTTSHGNQGTKRKSARQMLNSSLSMRRNSEQDNGHSSDLDRRKSGTLSVQTVHKENGTKSLIWRC